MSAHLPPDSADRAPGGHQRVRLSVVMPVHNSSKLLGRCVEALVAAAGPEDELILADDGSTDRGIEDLDPNLLAHVRVVSSATNVGPGPIRNLGVTAATGDVLVFVDSDVAIEASALERVRAAFSDRPDRVALIGSYDDTPGGRGIVSQYRNLLHHHTHQSRGPTASHFWTGIGAIRREVFIELGGLDHDRWARRIEDVEFGHRIVDSGHTIDVMPDIRGSHLKTFTVRSMVRIDVCHRAIPWSHLMIANRFRTDHFVTGPSQVVSVLAVLVMFLGIVLLPLHIGTSSLTLLGFVTFLAANADLWARLLRIRGVWFTMRAIPLHLLHTIASGVGFAIAATQRLWGRLRGRGSQRIHRADARRPMADDRTT